MDAASVKWQELVVDGRITKGDAINAVPSMGFTGQENEEQQRKKLSMLRRKVAERLVSAKK